MFKWYLNFYRHINIKKSIIKVTVLTLILSLLNSFVPIMTKNLIAPNIKDTSIVNIFIMGLTIMVVSTTIYFIERYSKYIGHRFGYEVEKFVRNDIFKRIINLDMEYINNLKRGEIGALITNDATNLGEFSYHIYANILEAFLSLIVGIIVMSNFSWKLTLVILGYVIITQSIGFIIGRSRKKVFKEINDTVASLNGSVSEQFDNILLVKTNNNESFEIDKFSVTNKKLYDLYVNGYKLLANFIAYSRFTTNLLIFVIIFYGSYLMNIGEIKINILISFIFFAGYLTDPIKTFLNLYDMIINAQGNISRLYTFVGVKSKITKNELFDFENGDIVFDNITFKYNENNIFEKFNLVIKKNSNVAIIGESGSGKTTLIKLLQRKFDINGGMIKINNRNISDIKWDSFNKNIAIISQNTPILNDTIENNIKYGINNVSEKQYKFALNFANLEEFISGLNDGDQTLIFEDGSNISGGQRQRIAIARAILKDAKIIIFDEATSALDNNSEKIIINKIKDLKKTKTIITIAHRLTTVTDCDELIMINSGNIIDKGTHAEMLEKNKEYKRMYMMYSKGENNA